MSSVLTAVLGSMHPLIPEISTGASTGAWRDSHDDHPGSLHEPSGDESLHGELKNHELKAAGLNGAAGNDDAASARRHQLHDFTSSMLRQRLALLPELDTGDDLALAAEHLSNSLIRALPLPGYGPTHVRGHGDATARLNALLEIAAHDVCLARSVDTHLDAAAILAEAGSPLHLHYPDLIPLHAVWQARHPHEPLRATPRREGEQVVAYELNGVLPFCVGSHHVTQALIVAWLEDDVPLLLNMGVHELPEVAHKAWHTGGLRRMPTGSFIFDGFNVAAERVVGFPGFYHARRGHRCGAVLRAACTLGGCIGLVRRWRELMFHTDAQERCRAHLGACIAAVDAAWAQLQRAGHSIDDAAVDHIQLHAIALCVSHTVEQACETVLSRIGKALGPVPLIHAKSLATQIADLQVHLRQCHEEEELAALGSLLLDTQRIDPQCHARWPAWL